MFTQLPVPTVLFFYYTYPCLSNLRKRSHFSLSISFIYSPPNIKLTPPGTYNPNARRVGQTPVGRTRDYGPEQ